MREARTNQQKKRGRVATETIGKSQAVNRPKAKGELLDERSGAWSSVHGLDPHPAELNGIFCCFLLIKSNWHNVEKHRFFSNSVML